MSFLNLVADLGAYLTILLGVSALDGVGYLMRCLDAKSEEDEDENQANSAFFVPRICIRLLEPDPDHEKIENQIRIQAKILYPKPLVGIRQGD